MYQLNYFTIKLEKPKMLALHPQPGCQVYVGLGQGCPFPYGLLQYSRGEEEGFQLAAVCSGGQAPTLTLLGLLPSHSLPRRKQKSKWHLDSGPGSLVGTADIPPLLTSGLCPASSQGPSEW